MQAEIIKIISYLNLLELPLDRRITKEDVEKQYRILAHIYHPDVSSKHYNSGDKFIKLKEAHDFMIDNIDYINFLIENNFSTENRTEYQNREFFNEGSSNTKPENKPQNYDINPVNKEVKNVNKKNKKVIFVSAIVAIALLLSGTLVGVIVEATKHHCSYSLVSKTEYCDKNGTALYECAGCGDSYTTTIKATGHNYVVTSEKAAKCLSDGSKTYKCTKCQDSYSETIKALGHNYGSDFYCANCEKSYCTMQGAYTVPLTINCYNDWGSKIGTITIKSVQRYYESSFHHGYSKWGGQINGKIDYRYRDYSLGFRWKIQKSDGTIIVDEVEKIDDKFLQGDDFTCTFWSDSTLKLQEGATYNFIITDARLQ